MKKLVSVLLVVLFMVPFLVMPANAKYVDYMYGDVSKDNNVDVIDATIIQRHIAQMSMIDSIDLALADFDNDNNISVIDATMIQRYSLDLMDHPRGNNDYLEFYVEIEDVIIESFFGDGLLENKAIVFTTVFDEEYSALNDKGTRSYHTFRGITDESFLETYECDYKVMEWVSWSFPSAGLYEYTVEIKSLYAPGVVYKYSKVFEVKEAYSFDNKRFVDYSHLSNNASDYPEAPADASDVAYEIVIDSKDFSGGYGYSSVSERFVALIHTKEEYDKLFEIENPYFTDEFFENNSLVVAVSPGYEHSERSPIEGIYMKDNELYVKVVYYPNNKPWAEPTSPTWYSFAAVDKSEVENIETVQRVR